MRLSDLFRHLGYEGERHTGCYGFGGRGLTQPSHYSRQPRRHFVLSLAEYRQILAITRSDIVNRPQYTGAVGQLGGGYGGADVFIDRCPWDCAERGEAVIDGFVFRDGRPTGQRYQVADDVTVYKAALRVMPTAAGLGMIPGSS